MFECLYYDSVHNESLDFLTIQVVSVCNSYTTDLKFPNLFYHKSHSTQSYKEESVFEPSNLTGWCLSSFS